MVALLLVFPRSDMLCRKVIFREMVPLLLFIYYLRLILQVSHIQEDGFAVSPIFCQSYYAGRLQIVRHFLYYYLFPQEAILPCYSCFLSQTHYAGKLYLGRWFAVTHGSCVTYFVGKLY